MPPPRRRRAVVRWPSALSLRGSGWRPPRPSTVPPRPPAAVAPQVVRPDEDHPARRHSDPPVSAPVLPSRRRPAPTAEHEQLPARPRRADRVCVLGTFSGARGTSATTAVMIRAKRHHPRDDPNPNCRLARAGLALSSRRRGAGAVDVGTYGTGARRRCRTPPRT